MSRIYKKSNFAGTNASTGVAFGGGGGNGDARRAAQKRREAQYGDRWSESACSTLDNVTALAGTVSFLSSITPGGQAVSLASGLAAGAGTAISYNKCD